jgi:hypothetical protein
VIWTASVQSNTLCGGLVIGLPVYSVEPNTLCGGLVIELPVYSVEPNTLCGGLVIWTASVQPNTLTVTVYALNVMGNEAATQYRISAERKTFCCAVM